MTEATSKPSAADRFAEIAARAEGRRLAVFLDFDGTLAPIVDRPHDAAMDPPTGAAVARLARRTTVAIVSGRDLADLRTRVPSGPIYLAGSHGYDLEGPDGLRHEHPGSAYLPALAGAEARLRAALAGVDGVVVERKRFAIAVHFRRADAAGEAAAAAAVAAALAAARGLRRTTGKKVLELRPDQDWHKGRAVDWLLAELGLAGNGVLPLFIGDDDTDEDAFRAIKGRGLGIYVGSPHHPTEADYVLPDPAEVRSFLERLAELCPPD